MNGNNIKLWWHYNEGVKNFGDLIGPYLVEKITGEKVQFYPAKRWFWPKTYMVVGSILGVANRNCIVWGAGIIERDALVGKAKFLAVRGPKTREILMRQGHSVPAIYGDPALLLPNFYNKEVKINYEVGIIPHIVDYEQIKKQAPKDVKVIDLRNDVEDVILEIKSCKRTVSSSLHGIIVSHAYGIPSIWMEFSDKLYGDGVKFEDYFLSVSINPYQPFKPNSKLNLDEKCLITLVDENRDKNHILANIQKISENLLSSCPFL